MSCIITKPLKAESAEYRRWQFLRLLSGALT